MIVADQPPPRPRELRADLPRELDGIILRLLSKDPDDRYASCAELASALDSVR